MNTSASYRGDMTDDDFMAWIAQQHGERDTPEKRKRKRQKPHVTIEHNYNIKVYKSTIYIQRDTGEEYEPPPDHDT